MAALVDDDDAVPLGQPGHDRPPGRRVCGCPCSRTTVEPCPVTVYASDTGVGLPGVQATTSRRTSNSVRTSSAYGSAASLRPGEAEPSLDAVTDFLDSRDVAWTTWDGWQLLDAHEQALGQAYGPVGDTPRERVKVVERQTMIEVSRAVAAVEAGEPGAEARLDQALDDATA